MFIPKRTKKRRVASPRIDDTALNYEVRLNSKLE